MPFSFRLIACLLSAVMFVPVLLAQKPPEHLAPLNQFSLGAEYSNDSSHIILGQSFNRRLTGLDLTWSRRVGRYNGISYTWEIETRPLVFLQDPTDTISATFLLPNIPPQQTTLPQQSIQRTCANLAVTVPVTIVNPSTGQTTTGTLTETRTCNTRWTYAGGLSPVGQRLNFLPRHPLQPYLLANGGFLVTPHDEPVSDSSRFNFTFTFGAGLQYFRPNGTAWSLDYRVQHLSSKGIGYNNPGIDSQVFRLSFTVPRLGHRRPR